MKLNFKSRSKFYAGLLCISKVGLRLLQVLLGFVALYPTYILPVLSSNVKPNSGRFRNRAIKVSFSIRLAVFGQLRRSCEVQPKWRCFLIIRPATAISWINYQGAESSGGRQVSNSEFPISNFKGWTRFAKSFFCSNKILFTV
jgi:hypothetical protein